MTQSKDPRTDSKIPASRILPSDKPVASQIVTPSLQLLADAGRDAPTERRHEPGHDRAPTSTDMPASVSGEMDEFVFGGLDRKG